MSEIIQVKDFSYRYRGAKRYAIKHADFTVNEGEFLCIIGPNGSGKSTLCNALVGLIPHYFAGRLVGDVFVGGKNTKDVTIADLSKTIGLVFQNPFNQLSYTAGTVAEELAYGLGNHGVPREEMIRRVEKVARLMRIDHILTRNPHELSGGQVQRVAFGSTFIVQPKVLVLDECTTQLDPLGSEEIFSIVKELNKDGVTVIMVDHDMERVAAHADRIMVVNGAEIHLIDTPERVFTNENLSELGINAPDFTRVSVGLVQSGFDVDKPAIRESEAVELVKGALTWGSN